MASGGAECARSDEPKVIGRELSARGLARVPCIASERRARRSRVRDAIEWTAAWAMIAMVFVGVLASSAMVFWRADAASHAARSRVAESEHPDIFDGRCRGAASDWDETWSATAWAHRAEELPQLTTASASRSYRGPPSRASIEARACLFIFVTIAAACLSAVATFVLFDTCRPGVKSFCRRLWLFCCVAALVAATHGAFHLVRGAAKAYADGVVAAVPAAASDRPREWLLRPPGAGAPADLSQQRGDVATCVQLAMMERELSAGMAQCALEGFAIVLLALCVTRW